MWQFQWMLSLIPDGLLVWIYSFILAAGFVIYFGGVLCKYWPFKLIPVLGQFPTLSRIVGGLLVILGIFLFGGYYNEMGWRDRVADMEEQVRVAEQKANDATGKIQIKIVEKVKKVKEVQVVIQDRIVENAKVIDAECKVAPEAIKILNDATGRKGTVIVGPLEQVEPVKK